MRRAAARPSPTANRLPVLFGSSRADLRRVFVEVRRKHVSGSELEPFERALADVIAAHPEYHALLESGDSLEREFPPEAQATNPFLHMAMHVSILEQVGTDRPPGIRAIYHSMLPAYGDAHALEHALMECLGLCLWEAARRGETPDEQRYLECVRRLAGARGHG